LAHPVHTFSFEVLKVECQWLLSPTPNLESKSGENSTFFFGSFPFLSSPSIRPFLLPFFLPNPLPYASFTPHVDFPMVSSEKRGEFFQVVDYPVQNRGSFDLHPKQNSPFFRWVQAVPTRYRNRSPRKMKVKCGYVYRLLHDGHRTTGVHRTSASHSCHEAT